MTTVTTRAGKAYEVCDLCLHWTARYVEGCQCCHPEGKASDE